MKKSLFKSAVIAATTVFMLTGCTASAASSSTSSNATNTKKVLRFGQANAGTGLDMQISTSSGAASIADEVTESLLRFNDSNEEEPVLLTDFPTVSSDGTVYTFQLKKGVHFTDGTELHAAPTAEAACELL